MHSDLLGEALGRQQKSAMGPWNMVLTESWLEPRVWMAVTASVVRAPYHRPKVVVALEAICNQRDQ